MEIVYRGAYTIEIDGQCIDHHTRGEEGESKNDGGIGGVQYPSPILPHRYMVSWPENASPEEAIRVIHIPTVLLTPSQRQDLVNAIHNQWHTTNCHHPKKSVGIAFLAIDDTIHEWIPLLEQIPCYYVVPMVTNPRNTIAPHVMAFAREVMLNNLAVPKLLQPNQYLIL